MSQVPPPMLHPSRPAFRLPAGAWDTHVHVYGPRERFPFAEPRPYTPDDMPVERLEQLHRLLGVENVVLVQATVHGFDNSALLDAIARDPDRRRGIALVPLDVADAELQRLHAGGVRGVRFNYASHLGGGADMDAVSRLADRLARLGWHLQFYMDGSELLARKRFLERLPVPFVIDHFGKAMAEDGPDSPVLQALLDLVSRDNGWVKLSGPDRISAMDSEGPVPWLDVVPTARRLLQAAPDRVLWGSDWPHPNVRRMPDDGRLVDLLPHYTEDAGLLERLLVLNPRRLYLT